MDLKLDSNLDSVETAEALVKERARAAGFGEDEMDRLGLAVHECMVNAVVHGNRYSKNKKVRLSIELEGGRLTVVITDEGEGYNPEDVPDPLAEENLLRSSGRGLLLIKAFVDEFKMRPTPPGGTEVTLIKYRNSE